MKYAPWAVLLAGCATTLETGEWLVAVTGAVAVACEAPTGTRDGPVRLKPAIILAEVDSSMGLELC